MGDLAAGLLESWLGASIVSAFCNLVLGRGLGWRPLFMGTQARRECEPSDWDPGQERKKKAGAPPRLWAPGSIQLRGALWAGPDVCAGAEVGGAGHVVAEDSDSSPSCKRDVMNKLWGQSQG